MTVRIMGPKKRPRGRPFARGISGNPGGKFKDPAKARTILDLKQMARAYTVEALDKLVVLMRGEVKVGKTKVPVPVGVQGWAASELLDRGWGKSPQSMEIASEQTITHVVRDDLIESIESRLAAIRERLREDGLFSPDAAQCQ
jgi:hypothetical protein